MYGCTKCANDLLIRHVTKFVVNCEENKFMINFAHLFGLDFSSGREIICDF